MALAGAGVIWWLAPPCLLPLVCRFVCREIPFHSHDAGLPLLQAHVNRNSWPGVPGDFGYEVLRTVLLLGKIERSRAWQRPPLECVVIKHRPLNAGLGSRTCHMEFEAVFAKREPIDRAGAADERAHD